MFRLCDSTVNYKNLSLQECTTYSESLMVTCTIEKDITNLSDVCYSEY